MHEVPTSYRQDDHNKIKDVPSVGEEVLSQGEELQHTLSGEDDDEGHVQFKEEILLLCALVVRLHHHAHHIEADEHHDEDVKELLSDEVKHHALDQVLQVRGRAG